MSSGRAAQNKENMLGKRTLTAPVEGVKLTRNQKLFNETNFTALMQVSEDLYKYLRQNSKQGPHLEQEDVGTCSLVDDQVVLVS